jgi:hypothetical protein
MAARRSHARESVGDSPRLTRLTHGLATVATREATRGNRRSASMPELRFACSGLRTGTIMRQRGKGGKK